MTNVNYKQYCQQSAIKRELRQRRATFQNEQVQSIKPFMSHRKQKNELPQEIEYSACSQNKLNVNPNQLKNKREYNYKDIILQVQQQGEDKGKFKYDVEQKENQIIQNQKDQKGFKLKSNADRISEAKKLLQKYNSQKEQIPIKIGLNNTRKEVQSIIFDSKVRKFEEKSPEKNQSPMKINCKTPQQHILLFQQKASQINADIEAGLTNIQQLLKQAKRKKQQKSLIRMEPQKSGRIEHLQKQFHERRNNLRVQQQQLPHVVETVKNQTKQDCKETAESQIQLQGDFKNKNELFPAEYISFINRLSRQIQKDIEFTMKIQQLTKINQINEAKTLIINEVSHYMAGQIDIDESFFKIQQVEIDPLEQPSHNHINKLTQQQLQQQTITIFKLYKDIQSHFNTKLYKRFSTHTIQLLFQQLSRFNFTKTTGDSTHVTIGHLLSYLNMRTNKCFRNRSFVKMLKRLSLKPNSLLTIQSFNLFIN